MKTESAPGFFGRLWVRLLAVTVTPVLITVVSVAVLANYVTVGQFENFMQQDVQQRDDRLQGELARYYRDQGSWFGVQVDVGRMAALIGERIVLTDPNGNVVADSNSQLLGQQAQKTWRRAMPVYIPSGQKVGTIYINPTLPGRASSIKIDAFLVGVNRSLVIGSVVAVLVGLGLTLLLSNRLRRQLNMLVRVTRQIGRGNLALRVPQASQGDLGELGAAVNHMAEDLEKLLEHRRQMVGDVAHELRNPLQNINGYIEALRDGVLPADDQTLAVLATETGVLRRLVDDLQDLSVAESGSLTLDVAPVDVREHVEALLTSMRPRAEELGVELEYVATEGLPRVAADDRRLRQVLANLITNALNYTPAGGRVTLQAETRGRRLRITVADTGPGIAPEDQPRIFERFYRVDPARSRSTGGAGLGLTIARELVRAMHGEIGVSSTPGQGARFWLELPLAGRAEARSELEHRRRRAPRSPRPAPAPAPAEAG